MARRRRATYKEPAIKKELVEVKCAFCQGTGRDPFGVMSPLSNCCVCKGKGVVMVAKPHVTCLACCGRGVINVAEKTETCPVCGGAGTDRENRYCLRCRGSSVIPVKEPAVAKGASGTGGRNGPKGRE